MAFTIPSLARVGLLEDDALQQNFRFRVNHADLRLVHRAPCGRGVTPATDPNRGGE